ncbi:MAG: DegT/DnrJ/EryC1/StrS family aminotransferase [Chitinophagaceae bacterium]|nr:MAG: DegT/DnrJ/EryC1/StrS family aminotransferase [Chitinophagaceae bacterium]
MKVPFSPPRIDEKIIKAVEETLRTGWISTGPKTKLFELELEKYTKAPKILCLNSATAGLELIMRYWGIGPGDEVIVPAYTYCATANVVMHCGAKPVMVDCGEDFNISPEKVEKAITGRTKAIVPVDIGGYPCDYDALYDIIDKKKHHFKPGNQLQKKLGRIILVADSAHSIGASYKGKSSGILADVSSFSFHAVKNLTTAEGGALCLNLPEPFNNKDIYDYLNTLSLHGQNKDALSKFTKAAWEYDVIYPGYKCNMTDIQASMGLVELERYERETLPKRKEIFDFYSAELKAFDFFQIPEYESEHKKTSYHLYLLTIANVTEAQRNEIIKKVFEKEISVNVHYKPLPLMSYYRDMGYTLKGLDVSKRKYEQEISLPVFFDLTKEQQQLVIKSLVSSYQEVVG